MPGTGGSAPRLIWMFVSQHHWTGTSRPLPGAEGVANTSLGRPRLRPASSMITNGRPRVDLELVAVLVHACSSCLPRGRRVKRGPRHRQDEAGGLSGWRTTSDPRRRTPGCPLAPHRKAAPRGSLRSAVAGSRSPGRRCPGTETVPTAPGPGRPGEWPRRTLVTSRALHAGTGRPGRRRATRRGLPSCAGAVRVATGARRRCPSMTRRARRPADGGTPAGAPHST